MSKSAPSAASNAVAATDNGPLPLRLAVLLLWIESGALAIAAVVELIQLFVDHPTNPAMAAALVAFLAGCAVLLAKLSAALIHRRVWGRGLAIVLQLFALPVAWFMTIGDANILIHIGGVALGVYCLATAACLLAPASRLALER